MSMFPMDELHSFRVDAHIPPAMNDSPRRLSQVVALLILAAALAAGSSESKAGAASSATAPSNPGLRLVAIGDSIPYNSPKDCPGCTGFVDRYARAVQKATGRRVTVQNLSQHNNLTLPRLLAELDSFKSFLAGADIIIVGIAHNTIELNADRPCGAPLQHGLPRWAAMNRACAVRSSKKGRSLYDRLYSRITALRQGKPTILRTINRYNDWIGSHDAPLTPAQEHITAMFIATWNAELCQSARAHKFGCADIARAFNGTSGLKPAGDLLGADYTHPSEKGHTLIARVLVALGFAPLA
jgi:lysophospholipase L1-like esterase